MRSSRSRRRRSDTRSRQQRRLAAWSLAASLALVAIGLVAAAVWSSRSPVKSAQADLPYAAVPQNAAADISLTAATNSQSHPVYRYSIVPGGVHSQEDVSKAIADDAVVAKHYEHIDAAKLRVEKLATDRLAYVSYRKGDQVYWTKRPVRIPAGDTVLTDGQSTIRARCGNCLSTAPMLPTSPDEPETVAFDALVDAPPAAQIAGLIPSARVLPGGASAPGGVPANSFAGGAPGAYGGGAGSGAPGGGSLAGGFGSGGGGVGTARSTPSGASGPSSGSANSGPGDIELPRTPPELTSKNDENPPPGADNPGPGGDQPKFTEPRDTSNPKSDDPKPNNPKPDSPKPDSPKSDNPKSDDPKSGNPPTDDGGPDDPPVGSTDVPGDEPPDVRSVPEPMSLFLLGTGVSGLMLRRAAQRRQRRRGAELP